ncbi:MAG: caspase family protein [Bacteroidia bacterium]
MPITHQVELPFRQSHAFIIGINNYKHLSPLRTAINDAKGLAKGLETDHNYIVHPPIIDPDKKELEKLLHETIPALSAISDGRVM